MSCERLGLLPVSVEEVSETGQVIQIKYGQILDRLYFMCFNNLMESDKVAI